MGATGESLKELPVAGKYIRHTDSIQEQVLILQSLMFTEGIEWDLPLVDPSSCLPELFR